MYIDIPSAVTPAEAAELQRLALGATVLEVGALLGYSTVLLALTAERVHSVDPHEGYPRDNPRPTLLPFLDNLERHGVRDRVTVHVGRDYDVLPAFRGRQFHLAFLDLTGEYEDTLRCMHAVEPLLTHFGRLAVHDCGHPDWPGAMAAAETFAAKRGTTFKLVDRLAIFEQTWNL